MLLACHVIARFVRTTSISPVCVAHEGQTHGELAINQVLQQSRYVEVVEREAPNNQIGPKLLLNDRFFVIRHNALTRRVLPAVEASLARLDVHGGNVELLNGYVFIGVLLGDALDEALCKTQRIAGFTLGTAVNQQNVHAAPPAPSCTSRSML